jgi:hypothetical protein
VEWETIRGDMMELLISISLRSGLGHAREPGVRDVGHTSAVAEVRKFQFPQQLVHQNFAGCCRGRIFPQHWHRRRVFLTRAA